MKHKTYIYLTSKRYPSYLADDIYAKNLAYALSKYITHFYFYIGKSTISSDSYIYEYLPWKKLRSAYICLYLPFLLSKKKHVVFFTNDIQILRILCFYKKLFSFGLCIDWHMPFSYSQTKTLLRYADSNVTTSEKLKKSLLEINSSADIHTVHGGVDLVNFTKKVSRKEYGLPEDKKLISYIGGFKTFGQEKGLKEIIDSLIYLPGEYEGLFVGGRSEEIKEYAAYAKEKGVLNRVHIIGRVTNDTIGEYMLLSDYLLIPYPDEPHFRNFGFPMKVYEYMASGRPIIYSKLELAEEVLSDCALGYTPGNAENLASGILFLESHPEVKRHNTEKALAKIKRLDWDAKAKKISAILEHI
jgi:glycosyltransferase involved in cell wall biosynthesis